MKPVYQSIVDPINGDCWAACIASILELPLSDVPNFRAGENVNFWEETQTWLNSKGVFCIEVNFTDSKYCSFPNGAYVLLTGPSTMFDDTRHCVIGQVAVKSPELMEIIFIHDPNRNSKSQYIRNIESIAIIGKFINPPPSQRQRRKENENH
jgi:hypothetical protein